MLCLPVKKLDAFKFDGVAESDNTVSNKEILSSPLRSLAFIERPFQTPFTASFRFHVSPPRKAFPHFRLKSSYFPLTVILKRNEQNNSNENSCLTRRSENQFRCGRVTSETNLFHRCHVHPPAEFPQALQVLEMRTVLSCCLRYSNLQSNSLRANLFFSFFFFLLNP